MQGGFREKPRNLFRRLTLVVMAIAHFVVSSGVPIPTASHPRKPTNRLFPCMDRPCGCQTYEQCWAGDCCCFTMAEKLAWARANNITPPSSTVHSSATQANSPPTDPECPNCVAKRQPVRKSCCQKVEVKNSSCDSPVTSNCLHCEKPVPNGEKRTAGWVSGLFAQKCRGESFAGIGVLPVAIAPEPPFTLMLEIVEISRLPLIDHVPTARATPPDAPPPKR